MVKIETGWVDPFEGWEPVPQREKALETECGLREGVCGCGEPLPPYDDETCDECFGKLLAKYGGG